MTAKELSTYVGKTGQWTVNAGAGVSVPVKINDARIMFGRVDLSVAPVGGIGECWVDRDSVSDLK